MDIYIYREREIERERDRERERFCTYIGAPVEQINFPFGQVIHLFLKLYVYGSKYKI